MNASVTLWITTFFLFISFPSSSQNDFSSLKQKIKGNWIRTHSEMKDSSKVIRHTHNYYAFLVYMFEDKGKGYATINPLEGRTSFDYVIHGTLLGINGEPYKIESITDSTLVLCEAYTNISDDKLHRNYYKRLENFAQNNQVEENKDKNFYKSSKILFPIYKGKNLTFDIEDKIGRNTFVNEVKVDAIITREGEVKDIVVVDKKTLSEKKISLIINMIAKTNKNWIPAQLQMKPVDTKVSFVFDSYEIMTIKKIRMKNQYIDSNLLQPLHYKEKEKAESHFQIAIEFYQNGNLEKAIKYFTKCIEVDNTYLDAYYNRAALNSELGNKEEACKDWRYLSELAQRPAMSYLKENCN